MYPFFVSGINHFRLHVTVTHKSNVCENVHDFTNKLVISHAGNTYRKIQDYWNTTFVRRIPWIHIRKSEYTCGNYVISCAVNMCLNIKFVYRIPWFHVQKTGEYTYRKHVILWVVIMSIHQICLQNHVNSRTKTGEYTHIEKVWFHVR